MTPPSPDNSRPRVGDFELRWCRQGLRGQVCKAPGLAQGNSATGSRAAGGRLRVRILVLLSVLSPLLASAGGRD